MNLQQAIYFEQRLAKARGCGTPLHLRWKPPVELFVIADPNPGDGVAFKDADRPVVSGDSHPPIKRVVEQAVEAKSRMLRIDSESLVSTAGRLPNLGRQLPVEFPEAG